MPSPFGVMVLGMTSSDATVTVTESLPTQPSVFATVKVYLVVTSGLATGCNIAALSRPVPGLQLIVAILPVAVAFNSVLPLLLMVLLPPAYTNGTGLTCIAILLLATLAGTV